MSFYTTKTRLTGTSGIDVESMVTSLMKAESLKYDKLKTEKTKLEWEQKAYQDLASTLKTFQTTHLDLISAKVNMRTFSTYNSFNIESKIDGKETNAVNITSADKTEKGINKIKIGNIATKDSYSGSPPMANSLVSSGIISGNFKEGDQFYVTIDNGNKKNVVLSASDAIAINSKDLTQIANIFNEKFVNIYGEDPSQPGTSSKVKATAENGVLSIIPTYGHNIKLENDSNTSKIKGSLKLESFQNTDFSSLSTGFTLNNVNVTVDTNVENASSLVTNINKGINDAGLSHVVAASLETATDGSQTINMNLLDKNTAEFNTTGGNLLAQLGMQDENLTPGNFKISPFFSSLGFTNNQTGKLDPSITMGEMFGLFADGNFIINGKTIPYLISDTVSSFMETVNTSKANVSMRFDTNNNSFLLESMQTGFENRISLSDNPENNMALKLGLSTHVEGSDAQFSVDGNNYTRSTNSFELLGMNFQLNQPTENDQEILVTAEQDVSKPLEYIRAFIDDYNKTLEEIKTRYNTPRSRKDIYNYYEPLTDEQKEAMSENEIENWENEGKKGLLYRDRILGKMLNTMRTMVYELVTLEDGRKISLYEIGISTSLDYREGGKLIIDESKLKDSLAKKPADVGMLFTKTAKNNSTLNRNNLDERIAEEGFSERVNDVINANTSVAFGELTLKAGASGSISSNEITAEIQKVDKRLIDMEAQLKAKEEAYYSSFARMEASINESNAQMQSLLSLGGKAGA